MNIRRKLDRLEHQHRAENPCAECAKNGGIRVATLEGDEPFDIATLACPRCGATPEDPIIVRLCDDQPPAKAVAGEGAA